MENLGDIKTAFYGLIGDREGVHTFCSAARFFSWLNKAVREMAQDCKFSQRYVDMGPGNPALWPAGSATRDLDADSGYDATRVWRVEVDGVKAQATTQEELRRNDRDWRSRSGTPYLYYVGELARTSGQHLIGLFPKPGANIAVRAWFDDIPVALEAADTDDELIAVPKWAVPGVLFSMLADFYKMKGPRQSIRASRFYRARFEEVKNRLRVRSHSKLPKSRTAGSGLIERQAADEWRGDLDTIA